MDISNQMLVAAGLMRKYLSDQLLRDIEDVGMYKKPYVLAEGIPELPDLRQLAINVSLGSIVFLGARPVAYQEENSGAIIREVKPKTGKENEASSHGKVALPMHSDMTYLRFPKESDHELLAAAPDFLILTCVKNEPKVPTRIVTIDQLKAALSPNLINYLRKPEFSIRTPDSVKPERTIKNRSIIYTHESYGDMIRYNDVYCSAETENGKEALDTLQAFVRDDRTGDDVVLEPGKVLIFNNRQVLHGRGAIPDDNGDKGTERWFMRVYAQRHDTEYAAASDRAMVQSAILEA
jgi:hypothetical protein